MVSRGTTRAKARASCMRYLVHDRTWVAKEAVPGTRPDLGGKGPNGNHDRTWVTTGTPRAIGARGPGTKEAGTIGAQKERGERDLRKVAGVVAEVPVVIIRTKKHI